MLVLKQSLGLRIGCEMARFKLQPNTEAVLWVAFGTALFSLTISSGKFASVLLEVPVTTAQIMFLRYLGGVTTVSLIIAFGTKPVRSYRSNRPISHFIRAAFGVVSGWLLIQASSLMPSVDATAFSLLYVVFIVLLGMLFLKERLGAQHLIGIGFCCLGAAVIMISRGAFQTFDERYLWPALLAVVGAVLMAVEGLLIKILAQADRPFIIIAHVNGFGLLLAAPIAFVDWNAVSLLALAPFVLLGPVALLAQYCFVRGYSLADIAIVGPAEYIWLVYSALIGFVFFHEVPTPGVIGGAAVIALGGITLALIRPKAIAPVEELA